MTAEAFSPYGIDYEDALDRFGGNLDLYRRLAGKYAANEHFIGMDAALEAGDWDQAYREAHALKGVAGNLSFSRLYDLASQICHALREGSPETAARLLPDARDAHEKARAAARAFQEGQL
ncbi:MAG: Hpt domain-containing protein [Eggerthellaceae bacterium]|nr:Hpt domain-containing protein [Eggerthellaceae bacterium]